jgi:putative membrane protein
MTDLWLAIAHHLLVFSLFGVFVAEFIALRPGLTAAELRRAAILDSAYGALAGLVIAAGLVRLIWGGKGWDFYADNPWFWAKMAAFAAVGLLSIYPTLRLVAWRKAGRADPDFAPTALEIKAVRRVLHLEALAFILIPVFAAAMARHGGF